MRRGPSTLPTVDVTASIAAAGKLSKHERPMDMTPCGQHAAHRAWTTLRVAHMPTGNYRLQI